MCVFGSGRRGWREGLVDKRIEFGFYQSYRNKGSVGHVFGFRWVGGLDQGLEGWDGVMSVCVVSLDSLCRYKVQVSVYCAWLIHAHLRCTQCSILCTIWISASYRVFVYSRYRKSRCVCVGLSDLDLSRHHPLL